MAKYNVHVGHCPQGKGAYGATGILKESVEDRLVKDEVIRLLKADGYTVGYLEYRAHVLGGNWLNWQKRPAKRF